MNKNTFILITIILIIISIIASCSSSVPPYSFITSWGNKGTEKGQFKSPTGIAIDDNAYIYILDSGNNRIQKFNSQGEFITKWGEPTNYKSKEEAPPGHFYTPEDIAINSDKIYIVDSGNNRIQVFNFDGKFLFNWGEYGSNDKHFLFPTAITINSNKNSYIVDNTFRLQEFNSQGKFITSWTIDEKWIGGYQFFYGLTLDSSGNIYISYTVPLSSAFLDEEDVDWEGYVQKYSPSGELLKYWGAYGKEKPEFNNPRGIAIDSHDRIFVAETGANRIQVFDTDGNFLMEWGSEGSGEGQFKGPVDVAIDSEGNVYVVDAGNHRIQKFAPNPNYKPDNN